MYDVFLGGPWQQFSPEPYKNIMRAAFPALSFYDPEERQSSNWFDLNLSALRESKILVAFIPAFPFPGVGPEVGIYYEHKLMMGRQVKLVAIWPDCVSPQWGKEVLSRMGTIVPTTQEAVAVVRRLMESNDDAPATTGRARFLQRGDSKVQ